MKRVLPIIILAVLAGLSAGIVSFRKEESSPVRDRGQMKVHFIDVGQGDCILLQTPDKRNILVDAGDQDTAGRVADYLRNSGVTRIDLLVITHPHADHIGGLPVILEQFGVSRVLDTGYPHGSRIYERVLSIIEARKIDYRIAAETPSPSVGTDVKLEVFWPKSDYAPGGESELNDGSIVMRASYGEVSILLTGDIESGAESRILAAGHDLRSTILKVAHHGGESGTSNEFMQVVQPEYAVISVGIDNQYHHPSRKVLRRLNAAGAQVYRTDQNGTIVFATNGGGMQVETER